jgi:hypothetical protein
VGLGFYAGNIYGAVTDAHKYNQLRRQEYIDVLKRDYLIESDRTPRASTSGLFLSFSFAF